MTSSADIRIGDEGRAELGEAASVLSSSALDGGSGGSGRVAESKLVMELCRSMLGLAECV